LKGTGVTDPPAKLIMAVMHTRSVDLAGLISKLTDRHGAVDSRSEPYHFHHSNYYRSEMGPDLLKFFLSFGPLVPQDRLYKIKEETNRLEREGAEPDGERNYNLDPGILTLSSVILATTKGYSHRIYMGEGIYQEVTLLYSGDGYQPLPWTYPDYRSPGTLEFMAEARKILKEQLSLTKEDQWTV
jgi:hypothetical protein